MPKNSTLARILGALAHMLDDREDFRDLVGKYVGWSLW